MNNSKNSQNINTVKQQHILMNMQNVAKTINLNDSKNHSDMEYSVQDGQPLDSSALVLKEPEPQSLGLSNSNLGQNLQ